MLFFCPNGGRCDPVGLTRSKVAIYSIRRNLTYIALVRMELPWRLDSFQVQLPHLGQNGLSLTDERLIIGLTKIDAF